MRRSPDPHPSPRLCGVLLAMAVVAILAAVLVPPAAPAPPAPAPGAPVLGPADPLLFHRLHDPSRTVVLDASGAVLATFTDGARTVALTGPGRTFAEPGATDATVHSAVRVRFAPVPWTEGAERASWFRPWLTGALADPAPDVLAVAFEYLDGSPDRFDETGLRIAGDASFGPLRADGGRAEASDFHDYLGVPWTFPDGRTVLPEPKRRSAVDCSGFIRLVVGYRLGFPLLGGNDPGAGLPRRAYAMAAHGPGTPVLPDRGAPPTELHRLQPGDLLFFVTDSEPGLDHSALYVGIDSEGRHRFVSSRSALDGPTIGDGTALSVLDGDGWFARGFRAARRL